MNVEILIVLKLPVWQMFFLKYVATYNYFVLCEKPPSRGKTLLKLIMFPMVSNDI